GAALDTYAVEPLPADSPLRTAPRTLLMPHCASNTLESAAAVSHQVCDAILAVAAGRVPLNVLNPEVLTAPNLRAKMA
ncbi:MAG: hydroxyacid dehydrogenase, partial [Armatimonadetes bacterium]|nr:hydroxyacid dehydrogenase [Armatimonadota bacterium]